MDIPFTFDKPITGKYFIGRKDECIALENMLSSGQNVCIYESPKYGISSLISQTLLKMRTEGKSFNAVQVDVFNIRNTDGLILKVGSEIIKSICQTAEEYEETVRKYLKNTHFIFDRTRYASCGEIISTNWDIDRDDIKCLLEMPCRIAADRKEPVYIIMDEFQRTAELERGDEVLRIFKEVLSSRKNGNSPCVWIFTGSQVNAMKEIFRHRTYFSACVSRLPLMPVDETLTVEYIRSCFNLTGKVLDREIAMVPGKLFEGNMWYINHFLYICDSLTKGYVNKRIMSDALVKMIAIHSPRFKMTMESLTGYQASFLMAIADGETRFSSSDVIRKYGLNSSANVVRVKDALMKKEIITSGDKDELIILDPLFKYWLTNYYYC